MNTLGKDYTRAFFAAPNDDSDDVADTSGHAVELEHAAQGYRALEARWAVLMAQRTKLGPEHHLLYAALRGRDWRRGFTPISNARKLENGGFYGWALQRALRRIGAAPKNRDAMESLLAPFDGLVSAEAVRRVCALLPTKGYYLQQDDLTRAYNLPASE